MESVTGYKFGFELGSKFGLKLNLNWNFEVFLKKMFRFPLLLDGGVRGFLFLRGLK